MSLADQVRTARESSTAMIPAGYERGWRRVVTIWAGIAVMLLFTLNRRLIDRFCPGLPAVWGNDTFPWIAELEHAYPTIRAELERYLATTDELPEVARFSGVDPDSAAAKRSVPLDVGHWRSIVLHFMGHWYESAEQFPETTKLTRGLRGVQSVGFSSLDPHSHIVEHRDPNPGGLRYQLPMLIPGQPGECRIRVVDQTVVWREGESVLFDLNAPHEVWNESDGHRVLMMLEVVMPLPFPLSVFNRFVQWTYRLFPSFRGVHARTDALYEGRLIA